MFGAEHGVGGTVRLPSAFRADVRRGDGEEAAGGRFSGGSGIGRAIHVARHGGAKLIGRGRIRAAGMGRLPDRLGGEFTTALLLHAREGLVFQKPGVAQGPDEVLRDLADFEVVGEPYQHGAQIEIGFLPVETAQALDQNRGDDQHGVRKTIGIADEKSGVFGRRGRHEIQVQA